MLKIDQLTVAYSSEKTILSDFSLSAKRGEIVGILGMNGAGKTTLFKTIYGAIRPQSGQIRFEDQALNKSQIAFLETTNFFYSYMRGAEYLDLMTNSQYQLQLNEIFELPLEQLIDNYSTGMKKRLAFWGIFELDHDLVILDEPFNGVDLESVECFYTLIEKMRQQGKTILISSHMLESLTNTCDRIAYLKAGQIQKIYEQKDFPSLQIDIRKRIKEKVSKAFQN